MSVRTASLVTIAVGPAERVLAVDESARTIAADAIGLIDLTGVTPLSEGSALASGRQGTIVRRASGWEPFAKGIEEDLLGVTFAGAGSVWAVGAEGAAYQLEAAGWRAQPTGLARALRTVAAGSELTVAAGDARVAFRIDLVTERLERRDLGTTCTVRGLFLRGEEVWFVASAATRAAVWRLDQTSLRRWGAC